MDDAELRRKIVGTWTLVSSPTRIRPPRNARRSMASTRRHPDRDAGRSLARADDRRRPDVPKTDADRAQALKTMIAYTGRYRVEDGNVITKVEAAWNEAWVGAEQVRAIRFDGDRLYIEARRCRIPTSTARWCG